MNNNDETACLRLFFENASDACVHVTASGTVANCNQALIHARGLPKEEIVGQDYRELFTAESTPPPLRSDASFRFRARIAGTGRPNRQFDWRVIRVNDGEFGLIGNDVTHEADAIENFESSEKRLAAILDATVDGIISIDSRGVILSANRAAEQIFQYRESDIVGKNVSVLMPEPYRDEHDDYVNRYLQTGERRIIGIGREVMGLRRNGTTFPMDLAVSEVRTADGVFFTGIVRDITQRRELEREILRISEEERRRIGQDLHDELGQMLTGTGLLAQNLTRTLEARGVPEAKEVAEITSLIKEADQYARTLAHGLVPVAVQDHGLASALIRLTQDATKLFGVDCSFQERGTNAIADPSKNVHVYRICQEAISNACKHGHATRIRVDMTGTPNQLRIRIRDNGEGFSEGWQERAGMGVHIMQYRAKLIGGSLDISTSAEDGTTIQCHVPTRSGASQEVES